jgi:hypothetical protein
MGNHTLTTSPAEEQPQQWRPPLVIEFVITVLTLAVGFGGGVLMSRDHSPAYARQQQLTTDEVLAFVAEGGARCNEPLRRSAASGAPQHTNCTEDGTFRFEVSVSDSVEASYESFDLATRVGCVTFDGEHHSQYFVVRDANWNLLTHDEQLASKLLQLRGVTVATGACDKSQADSGVSGPMRPS